MPLSSTESSSSRVVAEVDMRLCDALQASPRATWASIGAQLGMTAATARRRWQALVASGDAWITTYQGLQAGSLVASVEVRCEPGGVDRAAAALGEVGQVMTIAAVTGGRDLMLTVMTRDLPELRRVINQRIGVVPDITSVQSSPLTHTFREGSDWRSGALEESAPRGLMSASRRGGRLSERSVSLLAELQRDGRAPLQDVAVRLDSSEATVRRLLRRSLADGVIRQRVDVASASVGWPHAVTLWVVVPPHELSAVASRISMLPETRLCGSIAGGTSNLLAVLWLRDLAAVPDIEALVIGDSGAHVRDRSITLHYYKRLGHRLDDDGRHVDSIPTYVE